MRHSEDFAVSFTAPPDVLEVAKQATALFLREAFEPVRAPLREEKAPADRSINALAPHLWETMGKKEGEGISQKDLRDCFKAKSLSPEDAAVLCALRGNFDNFAKSGATEVKLDDLKNFPTLAERVNKKDASIRELQPNAPAIFKTVDTDKDDKISKKELDDTIADPKLDAKLKPVLEFIQANFKQFEESTPGYKAGETEGVNLAAVQSYVEKSRHSPDGDTSFVRSVQGVIDESTGPKMCRDLFGDKTDPLKSIRPDAVKQGVLGDCYFLSALASLAQIQPEAINKMIQDNKDGTYTVTFPYTPKEKITVSKPTNQEILTYARGGEHGIWPAVMEKAYGAWINNSVWRRNFFSSNSPDKDTQESTDGGSLFHHGLTVLTGSLPTHLFLLKDTKVDDIDTALTNSFKNKRAVTAVTGLRSTDPFLPTKHEYSVLDYDSKAKIVTVRNPWGHFENRDPWGSPKDGKDDGVMKMPLKDFVDKFSGVGIARSTPAS